MFKLTKLWPPLALHWFYMHLGQWDGLGANGSVCAIAIELVCSLRIRYWSRVSTPNSIQGSGNFSYPAVCNCVEASHQVMLEALLLRPCLMWNMIPLTWLNFIYTLYTVQKIGPDFYLTNASICTKVCNVYEMLFKNRNYGTCCEMNMPASPSSI